LPTCAPSADPFNPKVQLLGDLDIVCGTRQRTGTWLAFDGTEQVPAACMALQRRGVEMSGCCGKLRISPSKMVVL